MKTQFCLLVALFAAAAFAKPQQYQRYSSSYQQYPSYGSYGSYGGSYGGGGYGSSYGNYGCGGGGCVQPNPCPPRLISPCPIGGGGCCQQQQQQQSCGQTNWCQYFPSICQGGYPGLGGGEPYGSSPYGYPVDQNAGYYNPTGNYDPYGQYPFGFINTNQTLIQQGENKTLEVTDD